jgi:SAM-dependent methyltransferase
VASLDLTRRATEPERLDLGVPEAEARKSLADLRLVNRWLGNRAAFVAAVRPHLQSAPRPRLLDVGCGSADVPALLARADPRLLAVGADLKLLHLREAPGSVRTVVADAGALPFPPRSFDVVTASLFLHHFGADELPPLLKALFALARRALVVNDLRRARVPYVFGRLAFPLIFRSRVSVEDGLTSIRRGFTEAELRAAFRAASLQVRIRRTWPYRLLAVAERPGAP